MIHPAATDMHALSEQGVYARANRFLAGCGWFALLVGGGLGLGFGVYSQSHAGMLEPDWLSQIFSHVLLGRLPTILVAAFVLMRVNFQIATDQSFQHVWSGADQGLAYMLACGVTCMLAWAWFFLAVLGGTWLGMMHSHAGFGQTVWESYWGEFEWAFLLHACVRMLMLALCLSALTFVEIKLLKTHRDDGHTMMSRAMTLGMAMIAGIELLDLVWMLHA